MYLNRPINDKATISQTYGMFWSYSTKTAAHIGLTKLYRNKNNKLFS